MRHPSRSVTLIAPLRERDFALLLAGTLASLLGDGIYVVAVAFAVLDLSDGPAALSLVGLMWSVGILAFLLVGGVLADRRQKRHLLLLADVVRLVAVGVAGALSVAGVIEIWHLLLLSLCYGIGEGLSGPAMNMIVAWRRSRCAATRWPTRSGSSCSARWSSGCSAAPATPCGRRSCRCACRPSCAGASRRWTG